MILENLDDKLKQKPDCLIGHAGTNDLIDEIAEYRNNLLTEAKKVVKTVKNVSQIHKLSVLSSKTIEKALIKKDWKRVGRKVSETNLQLKNYCMQNNIGIVDNRNIKEEHSDKRGISFLAYNF